jgi:hypothetical protein
MADSQDVDAALVTKLAADATLAALLQSGASVFIDEAAQASTKFVIVSLADQQDVQKFEGRAFEDALYLVEARMLSTSGGNIKAAAARIDALLEGGTLTVSGYALMTMHRESRTRFTEVDQVDPSIRWYRRGGNYRVQVSTP